MKIIVCVMHGINCINRYENVMQTWGKDIDIVFFSDYENLEKKIYQTSGNNSYQGLEEKLINAVKIIPKLYSDYDWYFWCDDDTFLNVEKLFHEINNFNENIVYGKKMIHYVQNKQVDLFSGGGGTLISKKNMMLLSDNVVYKNLSIADVSLAMNLDDLNIQKENSDFFVSSSPEIENIKSIDIKNYITFHHIGTMDKMQELYNFIKNN